jgi:hypothetical protein
MAGFSEFLFLKARNADTNKMSKPKLSNNPAKAPNGKLS